MVRVMFDWCGKYIPAAVSHAPVVGDIVYLREGERSIRTKVAYREYMPDMVEGDDGAVYRMVVVLAPAPVRGV